LRFAAIYGTGAVVGLTPRDVDRLSMWEFMAAVEGWIKANSSEDSSGSLGSKEADEIWEWMQQQQPVPLTRMQ
jgi:hypothetical protein